MPEDRYNARVEEYLNILRKFIRMQTKQDLSILMDAADGDPCFKNRFYTEIAAEYRTRELSGTEAGQKGDSNHGGEL